MRISDWSSDVCSSDLPDAEPRQLQREGLGELDDPGLGYRIRQDTSRLSQSKHRSDIDDRAASAVSAHGLRRCLRHQEHAFEIDINHHVRSEEHTSELQSLMRISYAVFCLKKKKKIIQPQKSINTKHNTRTHKHNIISSQHIHK